MRAILLRALDNTEQERRDERDHRQWRYEAEIVHRQLKAQHAALAAETRIFGKDSWQVERRWQTIESYKTSVRVLGDWHRKLEARRRQVFRPQKIGASRAPILRPRGASRARSSHRVVRAAAATKPSSTADPDSSEPLGSRVTSQGVAP